MKPAYHLTFRLRRRDERHGFLQFHQFWTVLAVATITPALHAEPLESIDHPRCRLTWISGSRLGCSWPRSGKRRALNGRVLSRAPLHSFRRQVCVACKPPLALPTTRRRMSAHTRHPFKHPLLPRCDSIDPTIPHQSPSQDAALISSKRQDDDEGHVGGH